MHRNQKAKTLGQRGFSGVEIILIVVIVGLVGFTGWFVWHSKQNSDKTLNAASKSAQSTTPKVNKAATAVTDFASCKASTGSVMQETYPEVCVTKSGQHFTDTNPTVVTTTLSKAPTSLKAAITAQLQAKGCVNSSGQPVSLSGAVYDPAVYYIADIAASASACNARQLYSMTNGQWNYLTAGQDIFSCSTLKGYDFPSALLSAGTDSSTAQCLNSSDQAEVYSN